jgi:hypothetical protein
MAITLSKEELLSKISEASNVATQISKPSSSLSSGLSDFLNNFINSPVGQEFLKRLMDRWLPPVQNEPKNLPLNPSTSIEVKENKIDPNKLYLIILGVLNSAVNSNPNMTVSELKKQFEEQKDEIVKVIENFVKSI